MKTPYSLAILLLLAAVGFCGAAQAQQTDTATFNVTITITDSCEFATGTPPTDVAFGTHVRGTGAPVDSEGTLTINCSLDTPYTIGLNEGLYSTSATAAADNRRMSDGGTDYVPYGLYQDATRATFWGNVIGTDTLAGTGTGADETLSVYGRVPSTDFPGGTYTDTVTATITY